MNMGIYPIHDTVTHVPLIKEVIRVNVVDAAGMPSESGLQINVVSTSYFK